SSISMAPVSYRRPPLGHSDRTAVGSIAACLPFNLSSARRLPCRRRSLSIYQTMVSFQQRPVFILLQPPRGCIIFHPLGIVFHIQAVFRLAITKVLIEI